MTENCRDRQGSPAGADTRRRTTSNKRRAPAALGRINDALEHLSPKRFKSRSPRAVGQGSSIRADNRYVRPGPPPAAKVGAVALLSVTVAGAAISSHADDWHPLWLFVTLAVLGVSGRSRACSHRPDATLGRPDDRRTRDGFARTGAGRDDLLPVPHPRCDPDRRDQASRPALGVDVEPRDVHQRAGRQPAHPAGPATPASRAAAAALHSSSSARSASPT